MKTATNRIAQGDVLFRKVAAVPNKAKRVDGNGPLVVAHSETGHHHVVDQPGVAMFEIPGDSLVAYLRLEGPDCGAGIDVIHQRPWDTHETVRLLGNVGDVFEVRRQREWAPEGWRRVAD
jgi:hypothetical protein